MTMTLSRLGVTLALLVCWLPLAGAEPPSTTALMQLLPETVNAVAVIQVGEILKSSAAIRGNWAQPGRTIYLAGTVPINPAAQRMVIGSQFNPMRPGQSWHLALIGLSKPTQLQQLAEVHKGHMDEIAGQKVAAVNPYGYVTLLQDHLLVIGDAERQRVARWLRFAKNPDRKPQVAPYLLEAASKHAQNHLVVAIHTEDLIDPASVRIAVSRSKLFEMNNELMEKAVQFLNAMRGVRLVVHLGDEIRATAYLDSTKPARGLEILKPLVIEVLAQAGAELEDLKAAEVRADAGSLRLEFRLTDTDLSRILSIVSSPLLHPDPSAVSNIPLSAEGVSAEATHRYYYTINKLLDDLRRRSRRGNDYYRTALWHETAARRIETTSVLHVDPAVVEYAFDAALKLRAIADSLRGVPITLARLEAMKSIYYSVIPSGPIFFRGRIIDFPFVPSGIQTNIPEINERQLDAIQRDAENRLKLWDTIDANRRSLSVKLAEKYKIDFEAKPK